MPDYYQDAPESEPSSPSRAKPEGEEKQTTNKRGLINSDICPGLEAGDELELRVIKVMENEYEVEYEGDMNDYDEGEGEEKSKPAAAAPEAPSGGGGGMYE